MTKRFSYEEVNFCNDNITGNQFDLTNPNEMLDLLNSLAEENEQLKESVLSWSNSYNRVYQENQQLKNLIQHTYQLERTELGRNVLRQLLEAIQ